MTALLHRVSLLLLVVLLGGCATAPSDRTADAAPRVTQPALVLYGDRDEVTPPDPVEAAFNALAGEKTFRRYPEGWHLLFRDLQASNVWVDVADWIEDRS